MLQSIGASAFAREQAQAPASVALEQFRELIDRYPMVSEIELARLINLYRDLSALDVALMISDEKFGPKLDLFFTDHRSQIRTPFRDYAILVAIAMAGFVIIGWAVAIAA
jgi:hypothetical protein